MKRKEEEEPKFCVGAQGRESGNNVWFVMGGHTQRGDTLYNGNGALHFTDNGNNQESTKETKEGSDLAGEERRGLK